MEWDDLVCGICKEIYNETDKIPKILISCGHTFCSSCLESIKITINNIDSETEYQIICPEDNEIHLFKNTLDDFPRNMSLLKLIKKQNESGKNTLRSQNFDSGLSVNLITLIKSKESDPNNINSSEVNNANFNLNTENNDQNNNNNNNNNTNQEANSSLRNSVRKSLYAGAMNNFSYSNLNMKFCLLHNNRPLEILCLDHNLRLCSNCALFGEHKNHNIINEEDYIKELEIKAEVLIDFYELIDKNCSNLDFNFVYINNASAAASVSVSTQNQNSSNINNSNNNSNSKNTVGNLEKAILGIEKIEKLAINEQKNNNNNLKNININNNSQSENNNVNNKNTADITENASNSMINPRDFFDELALKANKKSLELKTKVDKHFAEINKVLLNRQKTLNEIIANFFEQINNKIHAYANIPNDIIAKAELWKQNVKNYFEMFNEITEKDDVIFKIIDSKVNSQDFIASAEQIMDEYIKLKNFPLKDLSEVIENVGVEVDNYEDDLKVNENNTTIDFFNSTKNTKKYTIKNELVERLEKIGVFNLNVDTEKINTLLQLDENDQQKINNIKTEKKITFNLNNLENFEKNLNDFYSGNKIQESNSKESLININNNNLSIKGEGFLNNSSVSNTTTKLADEIMTFSNNNNEDNNQYMTNQFINSGNNSFLNLSDDSLVFQNKNKSKSIFDKTKDPIVHSNIHSNKNILDSSHSNIIKINSNANFSLKSRSPVKLTSDKLIFIKTQMKNETANFTNYDIGDEGCKCISELLSIKSCKVKEIRLKKSNVSDEGFALLCKALENNSSVTILNLSRNSLSEKSMENVINLIKYNKSIKTINLDGNSYSTAIKEKIKSYVRKDLKLCF